MTQDPSNEELKALVIESLRGTPNTQFVNLMNDVERLALSKGFYRDNRIYSFGGGEDHKMPRSDRQKIIHIAWELILAKILVPGTDEFNYNLPFIHLTEFGKEQINQTLPTPYDPDNFLKSVKQLIPNIDGITYFYLSEALRCYHSNCYTASAVMIGAASENMIVNLCSLLTNVFYSTVDKAAYEAKLDKKDSISYKFSVLKQQLDKNMKIIPWEIADNLQLILNGIFDMIRNYRNESGHPSGKQMESEVAFANIQVFRHYAKRISDLSNFIKTKPNFTFVS